jgi:hypothetical protein
MGMGMRMASPSHSDSPWTLRAGGHFLPGMCRVACGSLDYATVKYDWDHDTILYSAPQAEQGAQFVL